MVNIRKLISILVICALAAAGLLYRQQREVERAQNEAGLASSRILSAAFAVTSELKVAHLSGEVLAQVDGASVGGWIKNHQQTIAPYSIDYFVDLRRLPRSAYRWNAKDHIMSVDVPDVIIADPNIDMSHARTQQSGIFISRWSSLAMQRDAAGRLALRAKNKANDPEYLNKAREGARLAIKRFVEAPLAAADMPNVTVVVRLPGDARPIGLSSEQWDLSRSVADILAGR